MNLKNLVISFSNGLIKNERQASIFLVVIAAVFFLISIIMLVNTFFTSSIPGSEEQTSYENT